MSDACLASIVQLPTLTRADLATLDYLMHCMIIAGVWLSGDRSRDLECDCIQIVTADMSTPALSIGVLGSGRYFCMDHRNSLVVLGDDLAEVLVRSDLSVE